MSRCKAAAARAGGTVRFVDRFVTDPEIPAYFRRADVVVLPYRRIDQSGVLYTALAFGKAMVLSDVGGFSEIGRGARRGRAGAARGPGRAARGAARLVDDPAARARAGGPRPRPPPPGTSPGTRSGGARWSCTRSCA